MVDQFGSAATNRFEGVLHASAEILNTVDRSATEILGASTDCFRAFNGSVTDGLGTGLGFRTNSLSKFFTAVSNLLNSVHGFGTDGLCAMTKRLRSIYGFSSNSFGTGFCTVTDCFGASDGSVSDSLCSVSDGFDTTNSAMPDSLRTFLGTGTDSLSAVDRASAYGLDPGDSSLSDRSGAFADSPHSVAQTAARPINRRFSGLWRC